MSEGRLSSCTQERAMLFWEDQSILRMPTRAVPKDEGVPRIQENGYFTTVTSLTTVSKICNYLDIKKFNLNQSVQFKMFFSVSMVNFLFVVKEQILTLIEGWRMEARGCFIVQTAKSIQAIVIWDLDKNSSGKKSKTVISLQDPEAWRADTWWWMLLVRLWLNPLAYSHSFISTTLQP